MPPIFEIAEGDLPFVRTRQALLLLDLQNDFLAKDCLLPVENPVNFIKNSTDLASQFRNTGDVIWVRSQFTTSRAINDKTNPDSELIITDDQLRQAKRSDKADPNAGVTSRPSSKLLQKNSRLAGKVAGLLASEPEDEEEDVPECENRDKEPSEAFLTPGPGRRSLIALPESPGANLALEVVKVLDNNKDLIFQKSHYSAFKDEHLIQTLRGKFVTELFICGSLTNISVFATAMDAARHGLAITLVEDCLGYRSKARHDESLRQLTDYTGCDIISSAELIEELKRKEKARARERERRSAPKKEARPRTDRKDNSALEQMMRKLQLGGSSTKTVEPVKAEDSARSARSQSPSLTKRSELAIPPSAGSHGNARDSFDDESTQDMELPPRPEPQKRERVKAKIKTRRRHSNSSRPTSKQSEASVDPSGSEPTSKSATTSTLEEASDALAKMSLKNSEETELAQIAAAKVSVEADGQKASTTKSNTTIPVSQDTVTLSEKQSTIETAAPTLCEGDTEVIYDVLTGELVEGIFEKVRDEVRWQRMSHQGGEVPRLVSVQGEVAEDGSMPIYRHPADESIPLVPFSPTIFEIKKQVEKTLGHSLNHVLIQFYRDGSDHITEHSDKTLDIVPDTYIANLSLGAQRTMVFRTKKQSATNEKDGQSAQRESCRAPLPHNSMCKMGLLTNMRWLHGIRPDKRLAKEKSAAELAYAGGRISLTFRMIGTFLDKGQTKIWGQGAISKNKDSANPVVNGKTPAAEEMLIAFGKENHSSKFDWKASYGSGFDVLHISNSRKLFLSGDFISDVRVKFILAELGIDWSEGSLSPAFNLKSGNEGVPDVPQSMPVKFIENDLSRSSVEGDLAVLLYLSTIYGTKLSNATSHARTINRFFAVTVILDKWRAKPFVVKPFLNELLIWDTWSSESEFIAGDSISIVDFAFWPLLDEIQRGWGNLEDLNNLSAYHTRLRKLASLGKVLESGVDLGPNLIVSTSERAEKSDEANKEAASPDVGEKNTK